MTEASFKKYDIVVIFPNGAMIRGPVRVKLDDSTHLDIEDRTSGVSVISIKWYDEGGKVYAFTGGTDDKSLVYGIFPRDTQITQATQLPKAA